jgi:formylglycine-generating enzyme required for sulfatase activity
MNVQFARSARFWAAAAALLCGLWPMIALGASAEPSAAPSGGNAESLRLAISDLMETFGPKYPRGTEFLARLETIEKAAPGDPAASEKLKALRSEALLANPLLDFQRLLLVRRKVDSPKDPGFPTNHECNSSLKRTGWDNEIAVLSPVRPDGAVKTLYRPDDGGYVGEVDLHWDAQRLVFSKSDGTNWKIYEVRPDGTGLRQVSKMPDDVSAFDPCYLPDGRIVFGSTASYQAVPCWHGLKWVTNLFAMKADGTGVRQLCFDQDHDYHPCVLNDGQVLYLRWDYTGISHIYLRELMAMNPDGTGQRAVYGSNSWFPNSLFFTRPIPGRRDLLVSILSGYHGVNRMGRLVILDTARGWYSADGIVHEIPRRGRPIKVAIRDNLVDDDWPKFLHPYPLSDKYFLVACWPNAKARWGIYLVDVFDNMVLLHEQPGQALLEPVPLRPQTPPPAIPDRVDLARRDGVVYLHNVYAGPGLAGVPRGTVKRLRVLAYDFGYPGLAGPDLIGCGGPWEVMRILGTVPLEEDGSALFEAPACTPLAVQALDAEGKAVQLMRSWFTLMPGEQVSCIGCHERTGDAPPLLPSKALASAARRIEPWRGPARGFDFGREVQPVLDRYCHACHDGQDKSRPDLRPMSEVKDYGGRRISQLAISRMHPQMLRDTGGTLKYAPAYDALLPYIRRVGIEDDVSLLVPGEFHADTSPLIQMLRKGHQGVFLDAEAFDRLITWIDLNAPCHGTWGEVYPIPDGAHERRLQLRRQFGGPTEDLEATAHLPQPSAPPVAPAVPPQALKPVGGYPQPMLLEGWPFDAPEAARRQRAAGGAVEKTLDLGGGVRMKLVRIPAGAFIMGDVTGDEDEMPLSPVAVRQAFWMGACEVTNAQFRCFDRAYDPAYYAKRHERPDDQGLLLNRPDQPAVRVSWEQAMAFCRWLSAKAGAAITLPTEAQWEYACRAGSGVAFSFGETSADFSPWANVGDRAFASGWRDAAGKSATGGLEHLALEGAGMANIRFDDRAVVTAPAGQYRSNAWGLFDMHGNAAEWTRSIYKPYPYDPADGREEVCSDGRRVVRGGSFFDPPRRCRSAYRLSYPPWQRVFNVGFRVICEE